MHTHAQVSLLAPNKASFANLSSWSVEMAADSSNGYLGHSHGHTHGHGHGRSSAHGSDRCR